MVIEILSQNQCIQPIHGRTLPIGQKVCIFLYHLGAFKDVFYSSDSPFSIKYLNIIFLKGLGVTTKLGIRQSYELGQYLRKRYHTILGNGKFSEDLVYVQSERRISI